MCVCVCVCNYLLSVPLAVMSCVCSAAALPKRISKAEGETSIKQQIKLQPLRASAALMGGGAAGSQPGNYKIGNIIPLAQGTAI